MPPTLCLHFFSAFSTLFPPSFFLFFYFWRTSRSHVWLIIQAREGAGAGAGASPELTLCNMQYARASPQTLDATPSAQNTQSLLLPNNPYKVPFSELGGAWPGVVGHLIVGWELGTGNCELSANFRWAEGQGLQLGNSTTANWELRNERTVGVNWISWFAALRGVRRRNWEWDWLLVPRTLCAPLILHESPAGPLGREWIIRESGKFDAAAVTEFAAAAKTFSGIPRFDPKMLHYSMHIPHPFGGGTSLPSRKPIHISTCGMPKQKEYFKYFPDYFRYGMWKSDCAIKSGRTGCSWHQGYSKGLAGMVIYWLLFPTWSIASCMWVIPSFPLLIPWLTHWLTS